MRKWKITVVEPSLEDLLADEMMEPVMRSAGVNAEELRAELRRAACRRARREGGGDKSCRWAMA
ncbi:MAG TPA: hypothetical protein VMG55_05990 [Stellaceae bacterium]|nr:hypothetical protein [Stellaceae bacterium]